MTQPVLFIGQDFVRGRRHWSVRKGTYNRYTAPSGSSHIVQVLCRHFVCIQVPEHNSSQLCPSCLQRTEFPFTLRASAGKPDLRVKRCANHQCAAVQTLHRDGHACLAFLRVVVARALLHTVDPLASRRR